MLNTNQLSRIDLNLRAASRLNLTPSAISHGLGRLRILLNDPLFLRMPKGVAPTERALALREQVLDILTRAQSMLNSAAPFEPATSARRFLIGGPDAALASTMEPFLVFRLIHLVPLAACSSAFRARAVFSRMASALAVHLNGFG